MPGHLEHPGYEATFVRLLHRLRQRKEWMFFAALPKADRPLAVAWWMALLLRGILPACSRSRWACSSAAVQRGDSLAGPLALVGVVFVLLQV